MKYEFLDLLVCKGAALVYANAAFVIGCQPF